MRPSLPGASGRSIANSSFTSAASAATAASIRSAAREAQKHTWSFFMVFLSGSWSGHAIAESPCHPTVPSALRAGSGSCLGAAGPFVEPDAAEARVAQRHERVLLDPAAEVAGLGVTHDLTRVADRLQIAGDDGMVRALNSTAAILSQLPCLGVWWISSRAASLRACSGGKAL